MPAELVARFYKAYIFGEDAAYSGAASGTDIDVEGSEIFRAVLLGGFHPPRRVAVIGKNL
jgi:hypothetical protein